MAILSDASAASDTRAIYTEVRGLVDQAHARALSVLGDQRPALEALASALLERETLTGAEVEAIGRPLRPVVAGERRST